MPHLAQGGIQLGLEIGGRAGGLPPPPPPPPGGRGATGVSPLPTGWARSPPLRRPLPPAAAGAKRCFQAYSRLALIPNSSATTSADLRLASQLLTASRLNVSSNLRRVL